MQVSKSEEREEEEVEVVVVVVVVVDDEKVGTKFPVYLYPQIKTMRHITFDHVSGCQPRNEG
jgi:hypothetical protein